jgi:hypothetical protein
MNVRRYKCLPTFARIDGTQTQFERNMQGAIFRVESVAANWNASAEWQPMVPIADNGE